MGAFIIERPDAALKGAATFEKGAAVLRPYKKSRVGGVNVGAKAPTLKIAGSACGE